LHQRGVTKPNIVVSHTAHAAFDKGCFYLNIELRKVNQNNLRYDMKEIKKHIDSNTICLVGSAPDYAFGRFDPLPEIAKLAKSLGIGCHSDCCLGSYVNPFMEEAGFKVPFLFDFRVEGVTSISCDPHKYCYGPKGLSVLMFRSKELRREGFFSVGDWTGGFYVTPSMAGSRPGSVIAGTWAAMMKQGREG
jgi:sphinganine-1-phosphate aldolase